MLGIIDKTVNDLLRLERPRDHFTNRKVILECTLVGKYEGTDGEYDDDVGLHPTLWVQQV